MSKKIIETEPVVIDEKDIITEEPSVEAPEEKHKLKIEISFCDKYTNTDYKVGDIVEFDEARAKELLADSRKLVSEIE